MSALSDAEVHAAAIVGKSLLKGMLATKLPRDAQVRAAIHALITVADMTLAEQSVVGRP